MKKDNDYKTEYMRSYKNPSISEKQNKIKRYMKATNYSY